MKLIYKFLLILLISVFAIVVGFYFTNQSANTTINKAKKEHTEDSKNQVKEAVSVLFQTQKQFVKDYSLWDDMAIAVQKKDIPWIETEFFGPLQIYNSDAAWVFTNTGELLFHDYTTQSSSMITSKNLPITFKQLQNIGASDEQVSTFFANDTEGKTFAFQVGKIQYHSEKKVSSEFFGYIIIAVELDQTITQKLQGLLQAQISINPYNSNSLDQKYGDTIIYTLPGYDSAPVAQVEALFYDTSLSLLTNLINKQFYGSMFSVSVATILCLFLIHQFFIVPVNGLLRKLKSVDTESMTYRQNKGSELQLLSKLIDKYDEQTETNNKLSKAVMSATDAIIITDKEGNIEYVNPAWELLNGYTLREVRGKNPNILKSGLTKMKTYSQLWQHLTSGTPYSTEHIINKRKDGSLYAAQISVFPVSDHDKISYYVGICKDISQRKARERLKSEFVSLASHQMRTPLTAMRWSIELFKQHTTTILSDENKELMNALEQNVMRMILLVKRLLNLSRVENGRLTVLVEEVPLSNFIVNLKNEIVPFIDSKKQKLIINNYTDVKNIFVDTELLHEIYINLFSNAIKYTPEKGTITCEITQKKDSIYCVISDTGIGIPELEFPKIFSRFYRASNAVKMDTQGSGLGLYLVKLLIDIMGGTIALNSKLNGGTQVTFSLPIKGKPVAGEIGLITLNSL